MNTTFYEDDLAVSQYLLFHYGSPEEVLPYPHGPRNALDFPVRCVSECLPDARRNGAARALDLGCAVGRSAFELTRFYAEVVAVDFSRKFIEAAKAIQQYGEIGYERVDEGELTTPLRARIPEGARPERVSFVRGDAQELPGDIGRFDLVLLANLIDRLEDPARCLERLPALVHPGGILILTSPYTWSTDFTPRDRWLGGGRVDGKPVATRDALIDLLTPDFVLSETRDLPFLIREHARKYQWSVAEATVWTRR